MRLLEQYLARYNASRPMLPVLLEAARDPRLPTAGLVLCALQSVERSREADEQEVCFALLVLQRRVTPAVLQRAYALLQDDAPAARQLGARILREHPGLDHAPHPHSPETIARLSQMLATESDLDVLAWGLSALGWQRLPSGVTALLRYRRHASDDIRDVVARNCLMGGSLTEAVAEAMLEFADDQQAEIRWSVFWDIAEYPALFAAWHDRFLAAAVRGCADPEERVRAVAQRARASLLG